MDHVVEFGGAAVSAEALFQRTAATRRAAGPGHVAVGRLQCLLAEAVRGFPGSTWVRRDGHVVTDTVQADRLFGRAAALLGVSLGEDHPEAVAARAGAATVQAELLGRRAQADPALLRALAEADACLGPNSDLSLAALGASFSCFSSPSLTFSQLLVFFLEHSSPGFEM